MSDSTPSKRKSPSVLTFDERMSDSDALMWNLESDPVLRSTILSVMVLDRAPDPARFERKLRAALGIIPRLGQRVVVDPLGIAPPKWEDDPCFDLRFHLRRARVPAPGDDRALLDFAEPLAMQAFDKDRPLWELHVVDGLAGDQCAVIMKLHHAISDGVGLVRMTECLIEKGPEDDGEVPTPVAANLFEIEGKGTPGAIDRLQDALVHRLRESTRRVAKISASLARNARSTVLSPGIRLREVGATLASIGRVLKPASEPLSPVMTKRSTGVRFDYLPVSLDRLKRAGKAVGGTVNDAFVAGMVGGLARYHERFGHFPEALRMLMPVNVRSGEKADRAGNQFAPARFEVPMTLEDPAERVREIGRLCRVQRDEPALPWIDEVSSVLGALPASLVVGLFGAMQKTTDFTTSNVPGPRRATYMSGARIERFMPFGPLAGAAANLTVFSYDGTMHIGVNTDPAAVEDAKLLLACLEEGMNEVLALADAEAASTTVAA